MSVVFMTFTGFSSLQVNPLPFKAVQDFTIEALLSMAPCSPSASHDFDQDLHMANDITRWAKHTQHPTLQVTTCHC